MVAFGVNEENREQAMQTENQTPQFVKVADIEKYEPALTPGGMRHLIFTKGDELEQAGVVHRFGRKLLVDITGLRAYIRNGQARHIAGRGAR